jgi:MFS family permease
MLDTFNPKKERSSSYLHCESASSSIENAGIAYQSPSLIAAGAGAKEIAWMNTITNLLFALLLVKVPSFIKFGDSLKRAAVILELISALGWLPLIIVPIFFRNISPLILILLWVISLVPGLIVGPLRDKWLTDIVPSKRLGRYLSTRSIISAGAYIGSFFVMGYFLDHFKGSMFNGFTVIFWVGFLVSVLTMVLYLIIKVPVAIGEEPQSDIGFLAFIREAKQNDLGTLIVFSAMIIFSASICGAFFSVYMLKDLHFTYLTYTMILSVEYVSRMVISYFGGRWVDNAGSIKVLHFASFMIPLIPILWVFSSNIGYLAGIQVLSGLAWATYDLCIQSYLFRATPAVKRLHYIIYHRSIVTLAAATGPLLGALLLNVKFPFFSNPILPIFLISGAMRFIVIITILPRLKGAESEVREGDSRVFEHVANSFSQSIQKQFPLYHADKRNGKPAIVRFSQPEPEERPGSFYHHEPWSLVLTAPRSAQNIRQDLRYHADPRFPISTLRPVKTVEKQKIARLQNNRLYKEPILNNPNFDGPPSFIPRPRSLATAGIRARAL